MKEETLYEYVEKLLKEQLECFATFQKKGTVYTGIADVIGIKDVGGRTSGDFEVIAVEVKTSTSNFAKNLGQALGYSLLAHRCYLATFSDENYTAEQEQMATHLGVGLLRLHNDTCEKISSSPRHQPIEGLMLKALESVGYAVCSICGTLMYAEKGWTKDLDTGSERGNAFYYIKKLPERRILFSQQRRPTRWINICCDCIKKLELNKTRS